MTRLTPDQVKKNIERAKQQKSDDKKRRQREHAANWCKQKLDLTTVKPSIDKINECLQGTPG